VRSSGSRRGTKILGPGAVERPVARCRAGGLDAGSFPRELVIGIEVAVEEVVGPPAVDGVGPVEPLDLGVAAGPELDVVPLRLGKLRRHPLVGGDAVDNAAILEGILAGSIKGSRRNLAVLNAAAGFVVTGKTASIEEGVKLANDLIDRGAAHAKLRTMQDFC